MHRVAMPRLSLLLAVVVAVRPATALAQSVEQPAPVENAATSAHVIRWYHGVAALAGLSALMLTDHSVQRFSQDHRGPGSDDAASAVRHFGQPEVYATVTLGLLGAGLITGRPQVTSAGGRLAASLALAGWTVQVGKYAFGRPRPEESLDADGYTPFSGQVAMPSGHTAASFALATSLADDIHRPWATVGLYGAATAVAWSRVNDNRHWLTDVAAGALVGITSAKLVSGRWQIFGIRPPSFLASPEGMGLGWTGEF